MPLQSVRNFIEMSLLVDAKPASEKTGDIGTTIRRAAAVMVALLALCPANVIAVAASKEADVVRIGPDQQHQVAVAEVRLHPFHVQRSAIGQIAYNEDTSTPVFAPFAGRVIRLIAKNGDRVKRGDPLLEIDSPEVVHPQNEFIAAVTAMNKARSQLELAKIVEKRMKDLYEGKAAALKEWQQAQTQLVSAQNEVRSAEVAVDAAKARLRIVGFTELEIDALQQKGAIRRATPILSPIDGTVIARKVGPGQYVRNDTADALFIVADLSTMWLKAQVPENDIALVRVGQEVEVKVSALSGRVFKARVTAISASTDAATRRVIVRSEVPNPDGALKAEMFADFRITVGNDEPSPAVPVEAVIREGDVASVWVEAAPMSLHRRLVKLGMEQDGKVQILQGLRAGERVVVRGVIFVDNEWRQQ